MIITENVNIPDSILFLRCVRESISMLIKKDNSIPKETKKLMSDYIMNEASDYEAMSLMMDGKLPDQKYNLVHEHELFSDFKESILENREMFDAIMGENRARKFVLEIGSIFEEGFSTATPILDFVMEQYRGGESGGGYASDEEWAAASKKAKRSTADYIKKHGKYYAQKTGDAIKSGAKRAGSAASSAASSAYNYAKSAPGNIGSKIKSAYNTHFRYTSGKNKALVAGKAVGITALIAGLLYGSYKVYKNYLSKAARACKGVENKSACMQKFKMDGIKAQIARLRSGMSQCSQSKDPNKCKFLLNAKIEKLQSRLV